MPITNWTEFFSKERDIYVQNICASQISLSFEVSPGHTEGFLLKQTRNPVNITQHIPFAAVKASADFRKMLNRRPPVLQVLTEEEYKAYYAQKDVDWKVPNADAAIDRAEQERLGLALKTDFTTDEQPKAIHKVINDGKSLGERKEVQSTDVVSSEEVIHPRVLHVCQQVHPEVPEAERMKAGEMLTEFENVENNLKIDDYEYIRAHGLYKTVKAWATKKISALNTAEEVDDTASPA